MLAYAIFSDSVLTHISVLFFVVVRFASISLTLTRYIFNAYPLSYINIEILIKMLCQVFLHKCQRKRTYQDMNEEEHNLSKK